MIAYHPAARRRPAQHAQPFQGSDQTSTEEHVNQRRTRATSVANGAIMAEISSTQRRESAQASRVPHRLAYGSSQELTARFARTLTLRETRTQDITGLRAAGSRRRRNMKNCSTDKALARRRLLELRRLHATEMQSSIQQLQYTIQQLERSRTLSDSSSLLWRTNRTGVVVDLCREYFAQFEAGYDPSHQYESQKIKTIRAFLQSAVEEDIVCREYRGVGQLLKQWEIYTKFHSDFVTRLHNITLVEEHDDVVSICCTGEMDLEISDATLRNLYPEFYALAQQNGASRRIAESLIGRRYVLEFDKVLHFNRFGKIFAHETKVHLASGLLQTLQDPFAAMQVLEGSVITVDGHWNTPDVDDLKIQQDEMYDMPRLML